MKKQRRIEILTVMSWENEYRGETLRAIALCDSAGYFDTAINCMRNGSMGEKDKNGVYDRKWWGDYIDCYGDEGKTLRPATAEEVALYKQYCPEQFFDGTWIDGEMRVRIIAEVDDRYGHHVVQEVLSPVWWKRLWNFIRYNGGNKNSPF